MPLPRLFDAYLAVDWSARSTPSPAAPSRDALWVGEALAAGESDPGRPAETYWRTRQACVAYIRTRLLHHLQAGRRVLLGCDFPYGYPAGYAAALGLPGPAPPWRRVWDALARLVVDDAANGNNRFAVAAALNARCGAATPGPLWGCPRGQNTALLAPTSPGFPYPLGPGQALARIRWVERRVRGVQPCWKLYGQGSVGGQALVGIPAVARLRDDSALAAVSRVWPFETGFTPAPTPPHGPWLVHAEIWPGIVPALLDPAIPIRDQAQVRAVVCWLADLDAAGRLGALFACPADLDTAGHAACVDEEGWLLGG
ncbi:MAG TPA: cobalamin biosynthesis protein CbiG [Chloroflexia bacterium]|nr:cobalamin biosynthesis protein CbiG [Chloroflexia bacterium]